MLKYILQKQLQFLNSFFVKSVIFQIDSGEEILFRKIRNKKSVIIRQNVSEPLKIRKPPDRFRLFAVLAIFAGHNRIQFIRSQQTRK